jgi:hypothetical protein
MSRLDYCCYGFDGPFRPCSCCSSTFEPILCSVPHRQNREHAVTRCSCGPQACLSFVHTLADHRYHSILSRYSRSSPLDNAKLVACTAAGLWLTNPSCGARRVGARGNRMLQTAIRRRGLHFHSSGEWLSEVALPSPITMTRARS